MKRAIIMGAGPAGLTAAYELLTRTDIIPVIIEQDEQVGGLSKTIDYNGNGIDIGGHRFFSRSEKIVRWWLNQLPLDPSVDVAELDITYQHQHAVFPVEENGTKNEKSKPVGGRMLLRPRKSRIYFNKSFFDYPLNLDRATLRNFGVAKLARIAASYSRAKLFPIKPERNLEEFFINRFGRELYLTFFKSYTEKVWGVSCAEIPADWGRQRIKDLNIGKALLQAARSVVRSDKSLRQKKVSTSLIEQFLYPEKGPGQLWDSVADRIRALGGEIKLGCRVEKIHRTGNSVSAVEYRLHGAAETISLTGDWFFSSLPVRHLARHFDPALPEELATIAANLPYRDFMIVGLLFGDSADGKNGRLDGITDNWIYLQDATVTAGRLQLFNNWSPAMVADPRQKWLGMEYFCRKDDALWNLRDDVLVARSEAELRSTGLIGSERLLDATVIRVPKAYPAYTGSYDRFDRLREYFDGISNLFLIGRNGMHRYNNTDHSMMTAMTAVDNLITGRTDRSNIWSVNMESDYHEERTEG